MNKKAVGVIASAIVILAVILVVLLNRPDDICSDDIRGYKREASSTLNTVNKTFISIKARIHAQEQLEVPQLDGLTTLTFATLRGIDTQCKLLRQCMRFVFFDPPSKACSTEYTDYKVTRSSALNLLEVLEGIKSAAQEAAQDAEQLGHARQYVGTVQSGSVSGSAYTSMSMAILEARVTRLKSDLSQTLAAISSLINGVMSNSTEKTDQ